jgi:energy-coupling factor transport system ATP-binding protein
MALIRIAALSHTYPGQSRPAIHDINLSIAVGDYVAIVGANGSGKSTLARCLNGLISPPPGTVSVAGLDPADTGSLRGIRRTLLLVFQSPPDQLVASVVEEDVAFGLENLGMPRSEMLVRVPAVLDLVGLLAERQRSPRFLSAGQQQRLAVAGVLVMQPRCIVFDEATAMIDPAGRRTILDLMDELVASGLTIIHVTHDMAEAARAARVIVLDAGQKVFEGQPAQLFAKDDLASLGLLPPPGLSLARHFGQAGLPNETPDGLACRLLASGQAATALAQLAEAHAGNPAPTACSSGSTTNGQPPDVIFELRSAVLRYLAGTPNEHLAIDGISVRIMRGTAVALIGATGSGKSSMLQLLDALVIPTGGKALAFGLDAADPHTDPRDIRVKAPLAVQRPESAIFERFCGDEVAFGPRNLGVRGAQLVRQVRSAMDSVGLPFNQFRDQATKALSGGQKRRLAIASILAMAPAALLFDEPTSALDPVARRDLMGLILDQSRSGRTVVFATHDMEEATKADLVIVMVAGRIVAIGPPGRIFGQDWSDAWGLLRPFGAAVLASLRQGSTANPPSSLAAHQPGVRP